MAKGKQLEPVDNFSDFLIYTTPNGKVKVEAFIYDENVWLTQKNMAELFGVASHTINYHLKQIFAGHELQENSVIRKIRVTADDGKLYNTNFYNLDAIISVGYRVNSTQATQFRIWATECLKEYIIKGFTMDDERLKNPNNVFGKDYFEEQLARIRDIRSSERRFYQKITELDAFLQFNEEEILTNAGKITAEIAKSFAENEFEKYQLIQDRLFESDFDKLLKLNNKSDN
ncbi:MAG: Virulence protein [Burkholderiales bacterium]|jgi:hypothetical protein|nr:Virulence protein [Burkholderiales bacterium]